MNKLKNFTEMQVAYGYWTADEVEVLSKGTAHYHPRGADGLTEYQMEGYIRSARAQIRVEGLEDDAFVYVVPHLASRPEHVPLQGRVYSYEDFMKNVYVDGNPTGIGCWNCRHEFTVWDGHLPDTREEYYDPTFYENEQKMRYLERQARRYKLMGDDDRVIASYNKIVEFSQRHDVPIQLNRTWTINSPALKVKGTPPEINGLEILKRERHATQGWYTTVIPRYNISNVNLLPRHAGSVDLGGTRRLKGAYRSDLRDLGSARDINLLPHTVRDAYTGRPYTAGRRLTKDNLEEMTRDQYRVKLHTSDDLRYADKTTSQILSCAGFYVDLSATLELDGYDPTQIYDNFQLFRTDATTSTSYGLYRDNDDVYRFFVGDLKSYNIECKEIFDYSLNPNPSKVNPSILDKAVKQTPPPTAMPWTRTEAKSTNFKHMEKYFDRYGVSYNPVTIRGEGLSESEIIKRIVGDDATDGSCVSQALTYVAQKNGNINTLDFRGGYSCEYFTSEGLYEFRKMQEELGVEFIRSKFKGSQANGWDLISRMEEDTEYLLVSGAHASIVKFNKTYGLQFLELQTVWDKSLLNVKTGVSVQWRTMVDRMPMLLNYLYKVKSLEDLEASPLSKKDLKKATQQLLDVRFGTYRSNSDFSDWAVKVSDIVVNDDFREMMGYLNTEKKSMKIDSVTGGER